MRRRAFLLQLRISAEAIVMRHYPIGKGFIVRLRADDADDGNPNPNPTPNPNPNPYLTLTRTLTRTRTLALALALALTLTQHLLLDQADGPACHHQTERGGPPARH